MKKKYFAYKKFFENTKYLFSNINKDKITQFWKIIYKNYNFYSKFLQNEIL